MPDFWQFPTVSLGIGPITSIYQARFMKYLHARGMAETEGRKVWAFCGDGEMDEPESMGAIGLAGREHLDNLIWVVNCNLQRLDGPVRGNGKIIQDLEAEFRGAGWNVIKVIWGSKWDPLLTADTDGRLVRVMEDCVDGEYQTFKSHDGAYVREHFFGRDPRLLERVAHMSDEEIWLLNRGGLDQQKVYAAYHAAVRHTGQPTVILAKTIKGYGMGASGEGQMITHQAKKMTEAALLAFRDRFELPLTDEQVRAAEYYKPSADSPEMQFLGEHRAQLGGSLPARRRRAAPLEVPGLDLFQSQLDGTGDREVSTTMAFVRVLAALLRDKAIADHIVPIVPDESRTFGMAKAAVRSWPTCGCVTPRAWRLDSLLALIEDFGREINQTTTEIEQRAKLDDRIEVLTQIRGVGRYTTMLIIAEVGDINRFPSARHLCAWAGLTPTVRSSDGKARLGHISRQGSPALRWALVEAAQKITTGSGPLREKYERIAKRRGNKIAKVAVAREILTLAFYGLRDGEIRCLARRSRASAKAKLATAA